MIWGCVSARGVDNIHSIDGIMVKYVHNDMLKKKMSSKVPSRWECHIYMFKQENSSKHNAELNRQWLYGTSLNS